MRAAPARREHETEASGHSREKATTTTAQRASGRPHRQRHAPSAIRHTTQVLVRSAQHKPSLEESDRNIVVTLLQPSFLPPVLPTAAPLPHLQRSPPNVSYKTHVLHTTACAVFGRSAAAAPEHAGQSALCGPSSSLGFLGEDPLNSALTRSPPSAALRPPPLRHTHAQTHTHTHTHTHILRW